MNARSNESPLAASNAMREARILCVSALVLLALFALGCSDDAFGGFDDGGGGESDAGAIGDDTTSAFDGDADAAPSIDGGGVEGADSCADLLPCCYFIQDENTVVDCVSAVQIGNEMDCANYKASLRGMSMCEEGHPLPVEFNGLPAVDATYDPFDWEEPCIDVPNPLRLFELDAAEERHPGPCTMTSDWAFEPLSNWSVDYDYDGELPTVETWAPIAVELGEDEEPVEDLRRQWTIRRVFDSEMEVEIETYESYPERWVVVPYEGDRIGTSIYTITHSPATFGIPVSYECEGSEETPFSATEFDINGNPVATTSFEFNMAGQIETIHRPDGGTRVFEYDEFDRLEVVTTTRADNSEITDRFVYSNAEDAPDFVLIAERDLDRDTRPDLTVLYEYDDAFNLIGETWIEETQGETLGIVEYTYDCWPD